MTVFLSGRPVHVPEHLTSHYPVLKQFEQGPLQPGQTSRHGRDVS